MNIKSIVSRCGQILLFLVGGGVSLRTYAQYQGFVEGIGLNPKDVAFGVIVSFFPIALLAGIVIGLNYAVIRTWPDWRALIKDTFIVWILSVFAAQILVTQDEVQFMKEAHMAQKSGRSEYHRDRIWPNQGTTLLWEINKGFWAVD
jgi:hypothetical protein